MTDPQLPLEQLLGLPLEITLPGGERAYLNPYTQRYGRSPTYARRMQRNYSKGVNQTVARGHRPVGASGGTTNASVIGRTRRGDEVAPDDRFNIGFQQRYGFSYSYWRRLYRLWIREINIRALPRAHTNSMILNSDGQRADPRVFPIDISSIKQLYDGGYRDPLYPDANTWQAWIELRLGERLYAIREFQDFHNVGPGRSEYLNRSSTWLSTNLFGGSAGPPIELWYYH